MNIHFPLFIQNYSSATENIIPWPLGNNDREKSIFYNDNDSFCQWPYSIELLIPCFGLLRI